MRTLNRYLLLEVSAAWAAVTGVLLVVLVANQLASVLGTAAAYGYPRAAVFGLIWLTTIQNLTVIVPVGLLFGIVLALGRLYQESEIAALRACGVGLGPLYRPVFALAAVVTAALAWLCLVLAPAAFARAQEIRREAVRVAQFGTLQPGQFHTFAGGAAVFYAESATADGVLHHVFVEHRTDQQLEVALADRAQHMVSEGGMLHTILLFDGERYELTPGNAELRRVRFVEHGIPIRLGDPAFGPARIETLPTLQLAASRVGRDQAEFQWRVSMPVMALLLTLIAVPLSELRPRQGRYARVGLAILVYFIYANLLAAARSWMDKGQLSPRIGMWWIHVLALAAALLLIWRRSPPAWWRGGGR